MLRFEMRHCFPTFVPFNSTRSAIRRMVLSLTFSSSAARRHDTGMSLPLRKEAAIAVITTSLSLLKERHLFTIRLGGPQIASDVYPPIQASAG